MSSEQLATFSERAACLACGSGKLETVASGKFDEGKLAEFISKDPWGENPAPFLVGLPWALVRCSACSLRYHRYILTPEWNERRFSTWMTGDAIKAFEMAEGSGSTFERAAYFAEHALRLESLLRDSQANGKLPRVLDFGCGDGEFLAVCGAFGFEAHGVDRSSARRHNSSHVTVHAEIEMAATHGPFDAVTLFEVLEHLDDPAGILRQLRSLMSENAILVLETPNCTGVNGIESIQDYRAIHPLDHINAFDPASLQAFAERLGFRLIDRPEAFVTMNPGLAVRNLAKRALKAFTRPNTRLYFRKT